MKEIITRLETLPAHHQAEIITLFGSLEQAYMVCYLIVRNEHQYTLDKSPLWEQKVATIHYFKEKIIRFFSSLGVDGQELWDDIASRYFEDYVAYREPPFAFTQEEFIAIIKRIEQL